MRTKIEGIGLSTGHGASRSSSLCLAREASERCLSSLGTRREDIGVVLYVSPYRDNYFAEPAFGTFVQRELGINHEEETCFGPRTLAFDLMNGAVGFLQGCQVVGAMIAAGAVEKGLVVSSDTIDIPLGSDGPGPGFFEQGAALLLSDSRGAKTGFDSFFYKGFSQYNRAYESYIFFNGERFMFDFVKDTGLEAIYLDSISKTLAEFLVRTGHHISDFDYVIPPQISSQFVLKLGAMLDLDKEQLIDVTRLEGDMFCASMPVAIDHLLANGIARPGKKALIVSVGSGIQVACADYVF